MPDAGTSAGMAALLASRAVATIGNNVGWAANNPFAVLADRGDEEEQSAAAVEKEVDDTVEEVVPEPNRDAGHIVVKAAKGAPWYVKALACLGSYIPKPAYKLAGAVMGLAQGIWKTLPRPRLFFF